MASIQNCEFLEANVLSISRICLAWVAVCSGEAGQLDHALPVFDVLSALSNAFLFASVCFPGIASLAYTQ